MCINLTLGFSSSLGRKGAQYVGLPTLPPSCANCLIILWATTSWSPRGLSRPAQGELYLLQTLLNPLSLPDTLFKTKQLEQFRHLDYCKSNQNQNQNFPTKQSHNNAQFRVYQPKNNTGLQTWPPVHTFFLCKMFRDPLPNPKRFHGVITNMLHQLGRWPAQWPHGHTDSSILSNGWIITWFDNPIRGQTSLAFTNKLVRPKYKARGTNTINYDC